MPVADELIAACAMKENVSEISPYQILADDGGIGNVKLTGFHHWISVPNRERSPP